MYAYWGHGSNLDSEWILWCSLFVVTADAAAAYAQGPVALDAFVQITSCSDSSIPYRF